MSIKRPIKRGKAIGPSPAGPSFIVDPLITGNYYVDDELTCDGGTVDDDTAAKFYQWMADGIDIPGATSSTYTIQPQFQFTDITCKVVASNIHGNTEEIAVGSTVYIEFGAKTRSGHGGFPLGLSVGATITGTNSSDWRIDERGHIVPTGTYSAYKSYNSTTYSLTIDGASKLVPIRIRSAQAHIREVTSVANGGTATLNVDASGTSQIRALLSVNLGQNGALVGNDIVKWRSGDFNPTNDLNTGGIIRPSNGWDITGEQKIYVESEVVDNSIDTNGNPTRGGLARIGRLYFLSGPTTDWTPIVIRDITFYTNNASISSSQSFVAAQDSTTSKSAGIHRCRFELGVAITGSPRTSFINIVGRSDLKLTHCHLVGGGNGILGGATSNNMIFQWNIFEEMSADCMQLNGSGHLIEDNFAFNYRPPTGAHPDFIQIVDGAGDKAQSIIRRNITVRNIGVVNEDDSTGIFGGPSTPDKAINWIIENNIIISSQINNIRLGGMDGISNRGNTSLFDIYTTDDNVIGYGYGWNRVEPSYPGTGGSITYNIANVFDWVAQTGATTTPNKTLTPTDTATYQLVFPNYPGELGDNMNTRQKVISICTPADLSVDDGGVKESDDKVHGALFPDGSWNDFEPYVNGRLEPAT